MNIRDRFQFEPVSKRIEDLETPIPVIDIAVVERNLKRWQARCEKAGLANRPHIKTHKLVPLAKAQIELGAKGITVQKLGEAEVMADAGIGDMLLTFNIVGGHKLERLVALARRTDISVVADNASVVEGLGHAGKASGRKIAVLVECDTGMRRNGVQSPAAAVDLAQSIAKTPGLAYGGLMTYPAPGTRIQAAAFLAEAQARADKAGLETRTVSSGGTPDMWHDEGLGGISEYRAGTYIYFDRSQAARGVCDFADCALTVLATVVSRPTPDRAIVDAGSKALTSDLLGLEGHGTIRELPDAAIANLSEEHGHVTGPNLPWRVGDLVRIVPNHVCPVSNLFDKVVIVDGDDVLGAVRVDARGRVD
jgi:D-serine deaminase-like pyridoxal phosphate-dependent protein